MNEHSISTISDIDFSAKSTLEKGIIAFEKGDFSEAAGLFSLALVSNPGNVDALVRRAEANFKLEQYQQCYDDVTQALQIQPDNEQALFRRGTVLAMNGHLEESLKNLDRLLELNRNHIEGMLQCFWVYSRLGYHAAAEEHLRTALVVIPDETPIQMLATQFCVSVGRLEAARTLLSSVITREPENVEALKLRGLVWRHLGVPDMAVSDFSYAIDYAGPNAEMLIERGVSFIEMGKRTLTKKPYIRGLNDFDQALNEFSSQISRPAVVLNQRALAWGLLAGRRWFDKSGYRNALDDYAEAITKEPEFIDPFFNRASLNWKLGNTDQVIEDCSRIIALKPDHDEALHLRAEAYLQKKENDKAEADFQRIDRIHAALTEQQKRQHEENRHSCDSMDCSRFCRK